MSDKRKPATKILEDTFGPLYDDPVREIMQRQVATQRLDSVSSDEIAPIPTALSRNSTLSSHDPRVEVGPEESLSMSSSSDSETGSGSSSSKSSYGGESVEEEQSDEESAPSSSSASPSTESEEEEEDGVVNRGYVPDSREQEAVTVLAQPKPSNPGHQDHDNAAFDMNVIDDEVPEDDSLGPLPNHYERREVAQAKAYQKNKKRRGTEGHLQTTKYELFFYPIIS